MILIARKKQMTSIMEKEKIVNVTILEVEENVIAKKANNQITVGVGKVKDAGKQKMGEYKELGYEPKYVKSVKVSDESFNKFNIGTKLVLNDLLKEGEKYEIKGVSKGKGFAGVMKRWNHKGGSRTRGQGITQRHQGSIGSQSPGKVWKGKHMPGRMGSDIITLKKSKVIKIVDNLVAIKGSIPGARDSIVYLYC